MLPTVIFVSFFLLLSESREAERIEDRKTGWMVWVMRHLFLVSFCPSPVWLHGVVPPWQRLAECWDWERKPGHSGWNTVSAGPEWASMSLLDAALQALFPWKPLYHNHTGVKADEYHNVLSMPKRVTRLSHLYGIIATLRQALMPQRMVKPYYRRAPVWTTRM